MNEAALEEEQITSCAEYCRINNVQKIVREAVIQVCVHKPVHPVTFLKEYFTRLELQLQVRKLNRNIAKS